MSYFHKDECLSPKNKFLKQLEFTTHFSYKRRKFPVRIGQDNHFKISSYNRHLKYPFKNDGKFRFLNKKKYERFEDKIENAPHNTTQYLIYERQKEKEKDVGLTLPQSNSTTQNLSSEEDDDFIISGSLISTSPNLLSLGENLINKRSRFLSAEIGFDMEIEGESEVKGENNNCDGVNFELNIKKD